MDPDKQRQNISNNTQHESRHEYFIRRLRELGMYDEDSDYEGELGTVIERMSEVFGSYGHSGASAHITMKIFNQLMHEWEGGEVNIELRMS